MDFVLYISTRKLSINLDFCVGNGIKNKSASKPFPPINNVNAVLIDAIVNWFNKNRIIYS
jgi:hypothetical protein